MYHLDKCVPFVGITEALQSFMQYLEGFSKSTILVGHNCRVFDIPVLLTALEKTSMLENFISVGVAGFVDTLPLFKSNVHDLPSYTQVSVYESFLMKGTMLMTHWKMLKP